MSEDYSKYKAAEMLLKVVANAEVQSVLQMIVEVASQVGVTELQGRPIMEFYETLRSQKIERGLASGSDHNPELVTEMKTLWESQRAKRNAKSHEE